MLGEVERLRELLNTTSEGDYLTRLANGTNVAIECVNFLRSAAFEEMVRDAGRYRHLRDRDNSLERVQQDTGRVNGASCYHVVGGVRELKWGDDLDAAIDTAMSAEAGNG
jgi:hypothetical protein